MPSEEDREKAAKLKREVEALRAKRNDPATPEAELLLVDARFARTGYHHAVLYTKITV